MSFKETFQKFLAKKATLPTAVFLFIAAWFSWLNWYPGFKDSDGFYHAKLVELMMSQGIVRDFHWLPLTVLADHFADHHLLYHALIIPIANLTGALVATKIISVFFGITACLIIFSILTKLQVKRAELFVLLLAITPYFMLRATMVKASGAAICIQLLVLATILFRKPFAAFAFSAIYVYMHGGFPFALVIVLLMMLSKLFVRSAATQDTEKIPQSATAIQKIKNSKIIILTKQIWDEDWKLVVAVAFGLTLGLLVNPYFPENMYFYWYQIVQIAVVGTPSKLLVGAEWYGANLPEFFAVSWPLLVAFLAPILALFLTKRTPKFVPQDAERFTFLAFLTGLTFVLTLRSNRHAEYFFPYFTLFTAYSWSILTPYIDWPLAKSRLLEVLSAFPRPKAQFLKTLCAASVLLIILAPLGELALSYAFMRFRILRWDNAKNVATFLKENTKPNEIVFDGNWDYFPQLWYWNSENRYISGLDSRFFAAKDPDLAIKYQELDVKKESVAQIFARFPVRMIVIPNDHFRSEVRKALQKDTQNFSQIYQDSSFFVFQKN